jgi:hypothetical protein
VSAVAADLELAELRRTPIKNRPPQRTVGEGDARMFLQVLDLDGGVVAQEDVLARYRPAVLDARDWGPWIRMGCGFGRFRRFTARLAGFQSMTASSGRRLTLYGSGDFHHVSLALVRQITTPFNLLVLDNHPDWMRGVPFLHCGTWLYHAARLPQVQQIFHVGGDVDFDNYYRWMAPWKLLREKKIVVFPGRRHFERGGWSDVPNFPIRIEPEAHLTGDRLAELIAPYRRQLASFPLYISLDKDVMTQADSIVNWDSGHVTLNEVCTVLRVFLERTEGKLAGMDIVGDWSPVRLRGLLRHFLHWTEHPALTVESTGAYRRNEQVNMRLLDTIQAITGEAIEGEGSSSSSDLRASA